MLKDNAGKISGNTFRVVNFSNADKPFSAMAVTGEKRGEVTLRIRTWWGIVICFSLVISGPRWMTLAFFALISFLALKEYCMLISVHFPRWLYWVIPLNYLLIGFNCFELFLLLIPLAGFLILATWRVFVGDPSGFLHTVSAIFWGWIMTVFALSHAAWLLMLPSMNIQGGALLVLFLLALTASNDIAQYLWVMLPTY